MKSNLLSPEIYRVVDANLNRLKEGIRVVEDIMRYRDNNKELSQKLKSLRHNARINETKELLKNRDSINDVLKSSTKSEQMRTDIQSIITANFKRAQESARVLEEIFKLEDIKRSESFKTIRYELYNLEKEIVLSEQ
ncbi:MAG: thiamine-phosphate pyrophosphorylase [Epsilonproteobacteria bacterium]|nr:thiamine-phosphate pyrophosphorylase [Campylobacterota bacterium]